MIMTETVQIGYYKGAAGFNTIAIQEDKQTF